MQFGVTGSWVSSSGRTSITIGEEPEEPESGPETPAPPGRRCLSNHRGLPCGRLHRGYSGDLHHLPPCTFVPPSLAQSPLKTKGHERPVAAMSVQTTSSPSSTSNIQLITAA